VRFSCCGILFYGSLGMVDLCMSYVFQLPKFPDCNECQVGAVFFSQNWGIFYDDKVIVT